jgi:hypothetical protein
MVPANSRHAKLNISLSPESLKSTVELDICSGISKEAEVRTKMP